MSEASASYQLSPSTQGLSTAQAQHRLAEFGPNVLQEAKRPSSLAMFARQFTDVMILILLAAAIISGAVADIKDTIVIVAIVLLNAVLGFAQEYRAERAIHALKALAAPTTAAIRNGRRVQILAADLVPGDVVLLEAGQIIPADLQLVEAAALHVDESTLTGESVPVEKTADSTSAPSTTVAERCNSVFKGTVVTYGRGVGVTVATGMATELGKIAAMLHGAEVVKTPLQRRLAVFGRHLAVVALIICAIVFVSGIARGEQPLLMFLTAVSLAVAAIPEALPAVVAITLALGASRMAKKQALIRKLPAVETLGSVTYICSDKTGTLTANHMSVDAAYCNGELVSIIPRTRPWERMIEAMALNNDAQPNDRAEIVGDPTEVALYLAAAEAGVMNGTLRLDFPRIAEIPFDSSRKRMTTIHETPDGGFVSYTKGAFESILSLSTSVVTSQGQIPISSVAPVLQDVGTQMAANGLRVLAFGMRKWGGLPPVREHEAVESDLTLLGFVGLIDPPRPGAAEAVWMCKTAGITPVMITGDHPVTAEAIARRLGILEGNERLMNGSALAALSPADLERQVDDIRVYARVAPEQKLQIVRALQARGEVVAMTGDGVNDSPALKQAEIGVAMGLNGTDVAKEVSSMVLLDDNFATIVRAIREGRKIYDNIRRFVKYALTTNSAEIWTIFLAPFLGLPIPLLPIHILWINLMTDGLPGLALAAEPSERDLMDRPPRHPKESIFAHGLAFHVVWVGLLMAAVTLLTEAFFQQSKGGHWQTIVFTVLCLSQLGHVLAIRSERTSLFTQGLLSNVPLAAAVGFTFLVQLAIIYVPLLNRVLSTAPLTAKELGFALTAASVVFFAVEIEKWAKRRFWPAQIY
jgi:Ca2+-transporting ATPase